MSIIKIKIKIKTPIDFNFDLNQLLNSMRPNLNNLSRGLNMFG